MKTTDHIIKEIRLRKTYSPLLIAEVLDRLNFAQKEIIAESIFREMNKKKLKTPWWKRFVWTTRLR